MLLVAFCALLAACPAKSEKKATASEGTAVEAHVPAYPLKRESGLSREAERGKLLYAYYCALCHGKEGNADGFNAYNLKTPPARHTDPVLMGTLSDTQIRRLIKEGGVALGRSPLMPPWGGVLSEREIAEVAAFVRALALPPKKESGAVPQTRP